MPTSSKGKVKPFKSTSPKKTLENKISSLPYDVLDTKEAKKIAKGNKYSFLHIFNPEIDFPQGINVNICSLKGIAFFDM